MKKRMLISNFNPRSHERSDKSERRINHGTINFNPRSHERSDHSNEFINALINNFNPRSHERSDVHAEWSTTFHSAISIHAPTRGATYASNGYQRVCGNFNPRSHERSDPLALGMYLRLWAFQSTLPREERQ